MDCVVYGPDLFWPSSVKRSAPIDRRDLQGQRWSLSLAPEPLPTTLL